MRLSAAQKAAVLGNRPAGAKLVRLGGGQVGVVWRESDLPPAERWRAQLLRDVRKGPMANSAGFEVWWSGAELGGRTRRQAVEALAELAFEGAS